jgi:hypothetical protein
MSRHGRKVGNAAGKRVLEVSQADDADCRADTVRLRPHENMLAAPWSYLLYSQGSRRQVPLDVVVAVSRPGHAITPPETFGSRQ